LVAIIAVETKVFSVTSFYKELKAALSHIRVMEWKYVNPMNHETFYFQQLKLIDEFDRLLKIMLIENKEYCPFVDDKENGLIRLFKDLNDRTYVQYACAGLSKRRFKTMKEFLDEYSEIILQHFQLSVATKEIPYHSHTEHEERQREYFKKRRELGSRFNNTGKRTKESSDGLLNHITSSGEEFEDVWRDANPYQPEDQGYESEDSVSVNSQQDTEKPATTADHTEDREFELDLQDLLAFGEQQQTKPDKKSFACMKKLFAGKCENATCPYGHGSEVLRKHASEMREKLTAFLSSQGSPNKDNPGYSVLKRDKFKN